MNASATQTLNLSVNGQARRIAGPATVGALLDDLGLADKRVAVEKNGAIVPRSRHAGESLADGDRIEIVHAIGGG